jgi:hypothetical protein
MVALQNGFELVRNPVNDSEPFGGLPQHDNPDAVEVRRVPISRPASQVFTPEEMDARIRRYAERAAQRLPLFHDGPAETANDRGRCWACEAIASARDMLVNGEWKSRHVPEAGLPEMYCPTCFGAFGWGDDDDIEASNVPRKERRKRYPKKRKRLASPGAQVGREPDAGGTDGVPAGGGATVDVQCAPVP